MEGGDGGAADGDIMNPGTARTQAGGNKTFASVISGSRHSQRG